VTHQDRSTDAIAQGTFPAHGRVSFSEHGLIHHGQAEGPFNVELIQALRTLVLVEFRAMQARGRWAHLATFVGSALATPESLQSFEGMLRELAALNLMPCATAHVMAPDVEGAGIMKTRFAACFAAVGLRYAAFDREPDAISWLEQELAQAGQVPPTTDR
jgi:hypothetical protein